MGDLNRVVRRTRAGGRRSVILGGHSLGASLTVAYSSWDFGGRPGHRDLDGMVLIDGGLLGTFTTPGPAGARRQLAALREADPFVDLHRAAAAPSPGCSSGAPATPARSTCRSTRSRRT